MNQRPLKEPHIYIQFCLTTTCTIKQEYEWSSFSWHIKILVPRKQFLALTFRSATECNVYCHNNLVHTKVCNLRDYQTESRSSGRKYASYEKIIQQKSLV